MKIKKSCGKGGAGYVIDGTFYTLESLLRNPTYAYQAGLVAAYDSSKTDQLTIAHCKVNHYQSKMNELNEAKQIIIEQAEEINNLKICK